MPACEAATELWTLQQQHCLLTVVHCLLQALRSQGKPPLGPAAADGARSSGGEGSDTQYTLLPGYFSRPNASPHKRRRIQGPSGAPPFSLIAGPTNCLPDLLALLGFDFTWPLNLALISRFSLPAIDSETRSTSLADSDVLGSSISMPCNLVAPIPHLLVSTVRHSHTANPMGIPGRA